jgi:hypothetical protein
VDGISILPEILGADAVGRQQPQHEYLYWEYGQQIAVRITNWKAICAKNKAPWELYDLTGDISESKDIAQDHAAVLARMKEYATQSHTPVQAGTFSDRTRHEADRKAKWGSTRAEADRYRGKMNRIQDKQLIPAAEMKLIHFSSENHSNDRKAIYAIDGNPRTVWHSQFSERLASHPHELIIDLGADFEIRGFRYLARQDNGWNGAFAETEFSVSNSPDSFGEPAVKKTFTKVKTTQAADCDAPIRGRYLRIRILSEVNGNPWASAAEIGVVDTR